MIKLMSVLSILLLNDHYAWNLLKDFNLSFQSMIVHSGESVASARLSSSENANRPCIKRDLYYRGGAAGSQTHGLVRA